MTTQNDTNTPELLRGYGTQLGVALCDLLQQTDFNNTHPAVLFFQVKHLFSRQTTRELEEMLLIVVDAACKPVKVKLLYNGIPALCLLYASETAELESHLLQVFLDALTTSFVLLSNVREERAK